MGISTTGYLILGAIALLALVMVLRSGSNKSNSKKNISSAVQSSAKKAVPVQKNPYRAVSINRGPNPCEAVKAIGSKRFLVEDGDAPELPLPQCDAETCSCKYAHHADRREKGDRREEYAGLRTQIHEHVTGAERRGKRGRRASDWE
jgi:hypothetical protein